MQVPQSAPQVTPSRALVSDASGEVAASDVTATEVGYLDGVTSAVQTQLDGKAASSHTHSAADITSGTLAVARGGTGLSSYAAGGIFYAGDSGTMSQKVPVGYDTGLTYSPSGGLRAYAASTCFATGQDTNNTFLGVRTTQPRVYTSYSDFAILAGTTIHYIGYYGAVIFNAPGSDIDFRVESDTDANCFTVDAGNNSVGVGVALGSHAASAKLQVDSTTKGFLPPRMTTTQRDLISSPAEGLTIYNTTTDRLNVYSGSAWMEMLPSVVTASGIIASFTSTDTNALYATTNSLDPAIYCENTGYGVGVHANSSSGTGLYAESFSGTGLYAYSSSGTYAIKANKGIQTDTAFYLGTKDADGSWRIQKSGDDLIFQQRESGTWTTKSTISGA